MTRRDFTLAMSLILPQIRPWRALAISREAPIQADSAPPMLPESSAIHCPLAEGDEGWIQGLAFSPDGKVLAAGNIHGLVKVFDATTGRTQASFRAIDRVQGPCKALAFSPNGRALAVPVKKLGQVATVDPTSGRILQEMEVTQTRESLGVTALAFSRDGKTLAGGFYGGETLLWDAANGRRLRSFPPQIMPETTTPGPFPRTIPAYPAPVGGLAFSPDGARLYIAARILQAWDVTTGQERPLPWPDKAQFNRLAASPDGSTLAVIGEFPGPGVASCRLVLFDVASQKLREVRESSLPTSVRQMHLPNCRIIDVAFTCGGKALVTLGDDRVIRLWDVASNRLLAARRFDERIRPWVLAASPRGRIAAGASNLTQSSEPSGWPRPTVLPSSRGNQCRSPDPAYGAAGGWGPSSDPGRGPPGSEDGPQPPKPMYP